MGYHVALYGEEAWAIARKLQMNSLLSHWLLLVAGFSLVRSALQRYSPPAAYMICCLRVHSMVSAVAAAVGVRWRVLGVVRYGSGLGGSGADGAGLFVVG